MEKKNDYRRDWLEIGYLLLADFISDREYDLVHRLSQKIDEAVSLDIKDKRLDTFLRSFAGGELSETWDEYEKGYKKRKEELNGDIRILRRILGLIEKTISDEITEEDLKAFTRKLLLSADNQVKDNK